EEANTIARWTEYEKGGHYPVLAVSDVWIKDVREFFSEFAPIAICLYVEHADELLDLSQIRHFCCKKQSRTSPPY
ncbi:MAG TPA: hypothetical protein VIW67_11675, partial [Terriglobales bacterium]